MSGSQTEDIVADAYPPRDHILRDLGVSLRFVDRRKAMAYAPIVPEVCTDQGTMQVGIMAILVDVLGGALTVRLVAPDWIATASLSIHTIGHAREGTMEARGSVIRLGRTMVVVEVHILEDGSRAPGRSPGEVGHAMMVFSRLPRREGTPEVQLDFEGEETFDFAAEGAGLHRPYLEEAGVRLLDGPAGVAELEMKEYVRNSLHALQGGMIAVLADVAGQAAARAEAAEPMITTDLSLHYLSPGKVGPFQTRTKILRRTEKTVLSRVEVIDRGAGDRLLAVAMNTAVAPPRVGV